MRRAYFSNNIEEFLNDSEEQILGVIVKNNDFPFEQTQRDAWLEEIRLLKELLRNFSGQIYFEYAIPRMGKRVDVVLIIESVIFVLEFKVGEHQIQSAAIDQVWDYALDLKNFHETSFDKEIVPVLIATEARISSASISFSRDQDKLFCPIICNKELLAEVIHNVLSLSEGAAINVKEWELGSYKPTPTIIEAAMALYNGHSVDEITRNDAEAINLSLTSEAIKSIITRCSQENQKAVCFVTGVPGAGKTLVGLNIATQNVDKENDLYSVFLSGNGPLVAILREALARNKVAHEKAGGKKSKLTDARREVKMFIQNVHNFRDECLIDIHKPPIEHVALFDEAQRAWDHEQTTKFMRRKRHVHDFDISEPEFLISCLDRQPDWAVIVCLVGGGQEINIGEAGIGEWIDSVNRTFPHWKMYISPRLSDSEYGAEQLVERLSRCKNVAFDPHLHLSVSMRSFRSELVSLLVKQVLDIDTENAIITLSKVSPNYPIVIARDLAKAKSWLKEHARGSERYGITVSSSALRLKPLAVDVKSTIDPIHWFLDQKDDVRSSYYLEDVATEFQIQGLELDWGCVIWDGDFRFSKTGWQYFSFCGNRWNRIKKADRQKYLKNAYRVLLTRARQGMVIVVPSGNSEDPTRKAEYYDPVFEYLEELGFQVI